MKKILYLLLPLICIISNCQNNTSNSDFANEYNDAEYKSLFDPNRYMMPTPEGVYVPEGLIKMNILDIYNYGKRGGEFKDIIFRDEKGNIISFDTLALTKKHLFTQMYEDKVGRVVEAVSFEVNDEFKNKVLEGYMPSEPFATAEDKASGKLKDRFNVPIFPGVYAPKGLRKLSIIEMFKLGDNGLINTPFVKKNDKGETVGEDYYTSGPGMRYMQTFVDQEGNIKEAVIYEMTDEISALFLMMRFCK